MRGKYDFRRLSHLVNVRVNEAENLEFKRAAERLETTRSRMLRKMIREFIGEGPDLLPLEWKPFWELADQHNRIGRNLNQLLRAYYQDQGARITVDRALLEEVAKLSARAEELINLTRQRSRRRWVKVDGAISALRSDSCPLRADAASSALSGEAQP